jgi:threonine/homoserine/homoserine lactone efflux protein
MCYEIDSTPGRIKREETDVTFELWFAFVVASAGLLAIPGPTLTLVVSYAINAGPRTGWASVPGVTLGDFTAMTASLLGAGAILATSAALFTVLKILGALYLISLGMKLWRTESEPTILEGQATATSLRSVFWNTYTVTALNPKDIIFFVAFVPQFVDPAQPAIQQFVILEATFLTMVALNITVWSHVGGYLKSCLRRPEMIKIVNRIGGSFLVGAGFLTATLRRSA